MKHRPSDCTLCKDNGLIPVRLINGASSPLKIKTSEGWRFVGRLDKTCVRCACDAGKRFEKNYSLFDARFCVSLYPSLKEEAVQ